MQGLPLNIMCWGVTGWVGGWARTAAPNPHFLAWVFGEKAGSALLQTLHEHTLGDLKVYHPAISLCAWPCLSLQSVGLADCLLASANRSKISNTGGSSPVSQQQHCSTMFKVGLTAGSTHLPELSEAWVAADGSLWVALLCGAPSSGAQLQGWGWCGVEDGSAKSGCLLCLTTSIVFYVGMVLGMLALATCSFNAVAQQRLPLTPQPHMQRRRCTWPSAPVLTRLFLGGGATPAAFRVVLVGEQ